MKGIGGRRRSVTKPRAYAGSGASNRGPRCCSAWWKGASWARDSMVLQPAKHRFEQGGIDWLFPLLALDGNLDCFLEGNQSFSLRLSVCLYRCCCVFRLLLRFFRLICNRPCVFLRHCTKHRLFPGFLLGFLVCLHVNLGLPIMVQITLPGAQQRLQGWTLRGDHRSWQGDALHLQGRRNEGWVERCERWVEGVGHFEDAKALCFWLTTSTRRGGALEPRANHLFAFVLLFASRARKKMGKCASK